MKITRKTVNNTIDKSKLNKEFAHLIDVDNLSETIVTITIEPELSTPDEYGGILKPETYKAIANMIKLQYQIPMKFLQPVTQACSYVSQKAQIFGNEKNIENAAVTIEPINPNIFQVISYTLINQYIPLGTIFTLNYEIPFINEDGTIPKRKRLFSSELKTQSNLIDLIKKESNGKAKCFDLCNKRIDYCVVDIGSKIEAKFIVEMSDLYNSMSLFRFRRPEDNIIEFITYDYTGVDIDGVFNMMIENVDKKIIDTDENKEFLKKFIKAIIDSKK